jgi:hypothetical protein
LMLVSLRAILNAWIFSLACSQPEKHWTSGQPRAKPGVPNCGSPRLKVPAANIKDPRASRGLLKPACLQGRRPARRVAANAMILCLMNSGSVKPYPPRAWKNGGPGSALACQEWAEEAGASWLGPDVTNTTPDPGRCSGRLPRCHDYFRTRARHPRSECSRYPLEDADPPVLELDSAVW